jgi:hypothetical protein
MTLFVLAQKQVTEAKMLILKQPGRYVVAPMVDQVRFMPV